MNKVSAQQIRSLELRIARLEKEAGLGDIIDDITGFVKGVVNIPKNFINNIINALKDVGNNLKATFSVQHDVIYNALESALGIRVAATLRNFIVDTRDLPFIVDLNAENPIKSTFTGGKAGSSKVTLDKLASLYEGEESKRIKAAYLSWKSDYASPLEVITFKADKMGIIKKFMKFLQRTSKIAFRFLSILFSVLSIGEVITAPWGQWILSLAMTVLGSSDMVAVMKPDLYLLKDIKNVTAFNPSDFNPSVLIAMPSSIITTVLKLVEKAFYRYGVNVDAFDAESQGKTASQFPRIASVTRRLEHYAYA